MAALCVGEGEGARVLPEAGGPPRARARGRAVVTIGEAPGGEEACDTSSSSDGDGDGDGSSDDGDGSDDNALNRPIEQVPAPPSCRRTGQRTQAERVCIPASARRRGVARPGPACSDARVGSPRVARAPACGPAWLGVCLARARRPARSGSACTRMPALRRGLARARRRLSRACGIG